MARCTEVLIHDLAEAAHHFGDDDIHVWTIRLDVAPSVVDALWPLLDPQEQDRACDLKQLIHRRRFVAGRGFQRRILAAYLRVDPEDIRYCYGPNGKPALRNPPAGRPLKFNLSNTGDIALIGVVLGAPLGVDVEMIDDRRNIDALSRRFFAPGEQIALQGLVGEQKRDGFFRCWTRKEAYIKALGTGLTTPLDSFEVTLTTDVPAAISTIDGDEAAGRAWTLFHLEPDTGHVAAVAIRGRDWRLSHWAIEPDGAATTRPG